MIGDVVGVVVGIFVVVPVGSNVGDGVVGDGKVGLIEGSEVNGA